MPLNFPFLQKLRHRRSPHETPPKSLPPEPFRHQPLRLRDEGAIQIRLLTLDPGVGDEEVRCRLKHVDLDESVDYEALSYVWGDPNDTLPIVVGNGTLEVTVNLFHALSHIRFPRKPRTLWVDAICIDQSNTAEKGHQVQFMSQIYKKASRVIAWLGEGDRDSDRAFEIVLHLQVTVYPVIRALEAEDFDSVQLRDAIDSMTTENRLASVAGIIEEWQHLSAKDRAALRSTFCNREYWQRVWIVQEVVLANNITMYCGNKQLLWSCIERLLSLVPHTYTDLVRPFRPLRTLSKVRGYGGQYAVPYLQVLLTTCRCSDQRDYVYALLGLSIFTVSILPDYTKAVSEVFHEATREVIRSNGDLSSVFLPRGFQSGLPDLDEQPSSINLGSRITKFESSWTIDWSANFLSSRFLTLERETARIRRRLAVNSALSFSDSRILLLKGVRHNTLTFVSSVLHFQEMNKSDEFRLARQVMRSIHKHIGTIRIEKVIQALFQESYRCRNAGEYRSLGVIEVQILKSLYLEWLGLDDIVPNEMEDALDLQAHHEHLSGRNFKDILKVNRLHGSAFFFSDVGGVGTVFGKAQPGDELWNIHGNTAPVILRPKQDESIQSHLGIYEFVGSVWISGMMGGEVWNAIDAYQESLAKANSSENGLGKGSDSELRNESGSEIKASEDSEATDDSNNSGSSTQVYFGFPKEEVKKWVEEEFLLA